MFVVANVNAFLLLLILSVCATTLLIVRLWLVISLSLCLCVDSVHSVLVLSVSHNSGDQGSCETDCFHNCYQESLSWTKLWEWIAAWFGVLQRHLRTESRWRIYTTYRTRAPEESAAEIARWGTACIILRLLCNSNSCAILRLLCNSNSLFHTCILQILQVVLILKVNVTSVVSSRLSEKLLEKTPIGSWLIVF